MGDVLGKLFNHTIPPFGTFQLLADDCAYLPVQAEKGGIHGLECLLPGSLDKLYHFTESGFGGGELVIHALRVAGWDRVGKSVWVNPFALPCDQFI
jgi:hypothetical protein